MPVFHFDLIDGIAARDTVGHECFDDAEARQHGDFIAQRIGTEKPEFANKGNYISVKNSAKQEIYQAPIRSALKVVDGSGRYSTG